MKIDAIIYSSHNPYEESCRVSRLRENLTSGSEGEGLETDRKAPRQSFTRQLFFKWIKQHLRIKAFYGTSENAVKTQIWIAISVYVLVAIVKKTIKVGCKPLHYSTDFECHPFRKNAAYTSTYDSKHAKRKPGLS